MKCKHLIVLDILGLNHKHLEKIDRWPNLQSLLSGGNISTLEVPFPAVTIPVQASITTGKLPSEHGMVANGIFDRDTLNVGFWEQYASLVSGERIWDKVKRLYPNFKTAVLFWQNTLYSNNDVVITPKPIHLEDGMIPWCYSKPVGLYENLVEELGEFKLSSYWGPLAGIESSEWIVRAAIRILEREKPGLLMVYVSHLDYCCQRLGPDNPAIDDELGKVDALLGEFVESLNRFEAINETAVIILSEYGFFEVKDAVAPNVLLRQNGFLKIREIQGKEFLDLEMSDAFAMVDHQVAHIYCKNTVTKDVKDLLENTEGVDFVLDSETKGRLGIDHERSGELIAVCNPDHWFSYYWWTQLERAPQFAFTVDIHRKPGYDPLELFFDPAHKCIPQDVKLIKGSHGRTDQELKNRPVFALCGPAGKSYPLPDKLHATDVEAVILDLLNTGN